jgi:hypothetical protein
MGTWSAAILGNDTSCEIKERFFEIHDSGVEPEEIIGMIVEEHSEILELEPTNFWLGLALASWECKALPVSMLSTVKKIVDEGEDITICRELDADDQFIKEREKKLKLFVKKLCTSKEKCRARKRIPIKIITRFLVGQCYYYKNKTNKYIGVYISRSEHYKYKGQVDLSFIDIAFDQPPTTKDFLKNRFVGLSKLSSGWDLHSQVYRCVQAGIDYGKSDKEEFLKCFDSIFTHIGDIDSLSHDDIIFDFRGGFKDYKEPQSVIEMLEEMRKTILEEYDESIMTVKKLLATLRVL